MLSVASSGDEAGSGSNFGIIIGLVVACVVVLVLVVLFLVYRQKHKVDFVAQAHYVNRGDDGKG